MVDSTVLDASPVVRDVRRGADLLAIVADPNRLALLQALTEGTTCVCELQQVVPIVPSPGSTRPRPPSLYPAVAGYGVMAPSAPVVDEIVGELRSRAHRRPDPRPAPQGLTP